MARTRNSEVRNARAGYITEGRSGRAPAVRAAVLRTRNFLLRNRYTVLTFFVFSRIISTMNMQF